MGSPRAAAIRRCYLPSGCLATSARSTRAPAWSRSSGCLPLSRKPNGNGQPGRGSSAYLGTMWVQVREGIAQGQVVQLHRLQVPFDRCPGAQGVQPIPGRLLGRELGRLGHMLMLPDRHGIAAYAARSSQERVGPGACRKRTPQPLSSSPWLAHMPQPVPALSSYHDLDQRSPLTADPSSCRPADTQPCGPPDYPRPLDRHSSLVSAAKHQQGKLDDPTVTLDGTNGTGHKGMDCDQRIL
jgi:hypothetical protein